MARKTGKAPSPELDDTAGELEGQGREVDDEGADGDDGDDGGTPRSKAAAARATLAEGITVPRTASAHIKKKYGIDISPQQFSAEKSRLKHRGGLPALGAGAGDGFFPASRPEARGDASLLEAMEVIKPLIAQLGPDKVKRMVDLLG